MEVHSSSSGAGSDENLSSSDLSERSGDHDHDYEDIYLVREESKNKERAVNNSVRSRSRDSGSHSRSASASSSNSGCNVVVKLTPSANTKKPNEFLPKPQKYEKIDKKSPSKKKESQESGLSSSPSTLSSEEDFEKTKLGVRHSVPVKTSTPSSSTTLANASSRVLKRVTSVPADTSPPPPPPLPAPNQEDDEPRGAEIVEVVEEPTLKPSEIVKGMCKSMSSLRKSISVHVLFECFNYINCKLIHHYMFCSNY